MTDENVVIEYFANIDNVECGYVRYHIYEKLQAELTEMQAKASWIQEWIDANPLRKRAYELDSISEGQ